jgi:hypothetical protein
LQPPAPFGRIILQKNRAARFLAGPTNIARKTAKINPIEGPFRFLTGKRAGFLGKIQRYDDFE